MAGGLEYANLIYKDFPITKTSTRQVEIRSDEESFCIHCVLDIFQSGYMCKNKTDPFQTQLNINKPAGAYIYQNLKTILVKNFYFPQLSCLSVLKR